MNKEYVPRGRKTRHNLSTEDKLTAIYRIQCGETKAAVSREIGVPESTLRGWCKRAMRDKNLYQKEPTASASAVHQLWGGNATNTSNPTNNNNHMNAQLSAMLNNPELISTFLKAQKQLQEIEMAAKNLEAQKIQQKRAQMLKLKRQQDMLRLERLNLAHQRQANKKRQEILVELFKPPEQKIPKKRQHSVEFLEDLVAPSNLANNDGPSFVKEESCASPFVEYLAQLIDVTVNYKGYALQMKISEALTAYTVILHERLGERADKPPAERSQEIGYLRMLGKFLDEFLTTGDEDALKQKIKNFMQSIVAQKAPGHNNVMIESEDIMMDVDDEIAQNKQYQNINYENINMDDIKMEMDDELAQNKEDQNIVYENTKIEDCTFNLDMPDLGD